MARGRALAQLRRGVGPVITGAVAQPPAPVQAARIPKSLRSRTNERSEDRSLCMKPLQFRHWPSGQTVARSVGTPRPKQISCQATEGEKAKVPPRLREEQSVGAALNGIS